MHISFAVTSLLAALAAAQTYPACTAEAARSDDCAAVINANACYNKFRWNAQTLTCIDGTDTKLKQQKVRPHSSDAKHSWLTRFEGVQVLYLCRKGHVRLGDKVKVLLMANYIKRTCCIPLFDSENLQLIS